MCANLFFVEKAANNGGRLAKDNKLNITKKENSVFIKMLVVLKIGINSQILTEMFNEIIGAAINRLLELLAGIIIPVSSS